MEDVLLVVSVYGGVILAAFWLAMIIWTYRDMRARSRDTLARLLVVVLVAALTLPGLLIYLMLRPRETLAEAYERSLEEEALLQDIEDKAACPACGQRVREEWQACPHCHTRLKKPCMVCSRPLELVWSICPYCTSPQANYQTGVNESASFAPPRQAQAVRSTRSYTQPPAASQIGEQLQFVEGDDL